MFTTHMKQRETVGSQSSFAIKATYITTWHTQYRAQIESAYDFSCLHC